MPSVLSKFFLSLCVAFAALTATLADGQTDLEVLADQSLNLYFSGFGAIVLGLAFSYSSRFGKIKANVSPSVLITTFFVLLISILLIIILGNLRNIFVFSIFGLDAIYTIPILRTVCGGTALGFGIWLAENITLTPENVDG